MKTFSIFSFKMRFCRLHCMFRIPFSTCYYGRLCTFQPVGPQCHYQIYLWWWIYSPPTFRSSWGYISLFCVVVLKGGVTYHFGCIFLQTSMECTLWIGLLALITPCGGLSQLSLVFPSVIQTILKVFHIKNYIQKTAAQRSSFASSKVFIRWWTWVQAWFRGWSIITTNPGRPSSISQYYQTLLDGV